MFQKVAEGWDDFEIDENETIDAKEVKSSSKPEDKSKASQDTGWDDFGDWGQDDGFSNTQNV